MTKIAFSVLVGTEGLRNVSVDKEIGCLENGSLIQNAAAKILVDGSHGTLLGSDDTWFECWAVKEFYDGPTSLNVGHI
jgi:hypothetical protein